MNKYLNMYKYKKTQTLEFDEESERIKEKKAYDQYMSNFTMPILNYNRIGRDLRGLKEYDFIDESSYDNGIDGHSDKRFVRFHKKFFLDYFESVAINYLNNCYVSHLNDIDIISGNIPNFLSVLIKKINLSKYGDYDSSVRQMAINAEYICPKIMNYFGVKTVYNSIVNDKDSYVLSLDFIKPGQHYFCSKELDSSLTLCPSNKIEESLDALRSKCEILSKKIAREFDTTKPHFDIEQIQREFIQTYLVRVLLLGDIDFEQKNFGFIYDSDMNIIETSAGFDYELTFRGSAKDVFKVSRNLKIIFNNYYEIFNDFINKLKVFIGKNKINNEGQSPALELFENGIDNESVAECFYDIFKANTEFLINKFQEFENEKIQGQSK